MNGLFANIQIAVRMELAVDWKEMLIFKLWVIRPKNSFARFNGI